MKYKIREDATSELLFLYSEHINNLHHAAARAHGSNITYREPTIREFVEVEAEDDEYFWEWIYDTKGLVKNPDEEQFDEFIDMLMLEILQAKSTDDENKTTN